MALKSNQVPVPLSKHKAGNATVVHQRDATTNQIIRSWPTLTDTAIYLNKSRTVTCVLKRKEQFLIDNIESVLRYA